LARQIVREVALLAVLLDPRLVHARQVPWELLVCLMDTGRRFPSAHRGTRQARFPMRDQGLWGCAVHVRAVGERSMGAVRA
jgi:hypothetical protein